MIAAEGILTAKGGVSSHAALVARPDGQSLRLRRRHAPHDYGSKTVTVDGSVFREGDSLSIDGTVGEVYPGDIATAAPKSSRFSSRNPHARGKPDLPELREADELVRKATRMDVRRTRTTRNRRQRRRLRAAGIGSAAPSTCSSRATAIDACAR